MKQQQDITTDAHLTTDELDQVENNIQSQLIGRLRGFRLKRQGKGVVLMGRAGSYHAKQLAQHAVMKATPLRILRNDIEVM